MRVLPIPGGSYGENLPSGAYAVLIPGSHIETHLGRVALPTPGSWPLYLRISDGPKGFQIAGQASASIGTWHYKGGAWTLDPRICNGTSAAIFDQRGELHIIEPWPGVTTQGYRFVADDGSLVSGDATYYDQADDLSEFTEYRIGDDWLAIGQGHDHGGAAALYFGVRRLLESGNCTFIRFSHALDLLAVTILKPGVTILRWLTTAELSGFPLDVPPVVVPPEIPPVEPPQPTEPPVSVPNIGEFVRSFLAPRLRIVGTEDDTRANTFAAVNACVLEARKTDPRWGLLEKTGGANVRQRAADIMLYKISDTQAQVVDVVGNGEGEADTPGGPRRPPVATFNVAVPSDPGAIRDIAQWKEPYPDADVPPVVVPPVDPTVPLPIAALQAAVAALALAVGRQDSQLADQEQRIKALEDKPAEPPAEMRVTGRTKQFGVSFLAHSHEIDLPVVRK